MLFPGRTVPTPYKDETAYQGTDGVGRVFTVAYVDLATRIGLCIDKTPNGGRPLVFDS